MIQIEPNEEEVYTMLRELHKVTGFRISIHDTNQHEIAAYPEELGPFCALIQKNPKARKLCLLNDAEAFRTVRESKEVSIYHCQFGLCEAVAPLYYADMLIGYLMMGQVLDSSPDSHNAVKNAADKYVADKARLQQVLKQIPVSTKDKIASYIYIMRICAVYLTMNNRLKLIRQDLVHEVKVYLDHNYMEKINISLLCRQFFCSKVTLMNAFRKRYGETVNQYLTRIRLSHARQLLADPSLTIHKIAERCGIPDQNYFTKLFQKEYGITPTEYRKQSSGG